VYIPGRCRKLKDILLFVERTPAPSLLPVFRSQQQAELLALLLGDPALELSLTDLAAQTGIPHPSVYREVERAEAAGLVTSRRVGRTRLVRANVESPYYDGLAEVLTRAFGVPAVLGDAVSGIAGVEGAYVFGSWAARHAGERGIRPVGDIDLLVLGTPDRDALYDAVHVAERRLGREVQVTVREAGWLKHGTGSFHDTVTSRPMLRVDVAATRRNDPETRNGEAPPRPGPQRD
jgi:DNA-binding transcriptional ArsR family regulator